MKRLRIFIIVSALFTTPVFADFVIFNNVIVDRSQIYFYLDSSSLASKGNKADKRIRAGVILGQNKKYYADCADKFVPEIVNPALLKVSKILDTTKKIDLLGILYSIGLKDCRQGVTNMDK